MAVPVVTVVSSTGLLPPLAGVIRALALQSALAHCESTAWTWSTPIGSALLLVRRTRTWASTSPVRSPATGPPARMLKCDPIRRAPDWPTAGLAAHGSSCLTVWTATVALSDLTGVVNGRPLLNDSMVSPASLAVLEYRRSEEHTSELQSHHDLVC